MLRLLHLTCFGDRQGYTPYGYGMDTPVLVKSSVSYGRGWQLLRSRGEGSTATGPCDPPQLASSCNASVDLSGPSENADMPRAAPSVLCGGASPPALPTDRAAIVLVIDGNASNLRFFYGKDVAKAYGSQLSLAVRLLASLRAVKTTLPIWLLVSGYRVPAAEERLVASFGVTIVPPERFGVSIVPTWASKWARPSFAKLRVLGLTGLDRAIVLDTDSLVLHNIDHLASVSAPAFVLGWKCYPRRELRASLMVVAPTPADWERARFLMGEASTAIYDDLGEQSVWRKLYATVHELPAGYAALRSTDFSAEEWGKAHVLHDPNLLRKSSRAGWQASRMAERLKEHDARVGVEMGALTPLLQEHAKTTKLASRGSSKKARTKKRRGKRI